MTSGLLAANIADTPWGNRNIGQTFPDLGTLVTIILKNSITIVSLILLAYLIFGGLSFIIGAGSGDPKKAAAGKSAIFNALIGFIIVIFAYAIIQVVEVITGLQILNSNL